MMRLNASFCAWVISASACLCSAANPGVSGREAHVWERHHLSVVVARVLEVKHEPEENGVYWSLKLRPIVRVAGELDPSTHPELNIEIDVCEICNVTAVPAKGAVVMVVLLGTKCFSAIYDFMPNGVPLAILDGLGDKQIEQTLEKIRDDRAHPDPDPTSAKDEKAPPGETKP